MLKKVNGFQSLTNFAIKTILDIWLGFECISADIEIFCSYWIKFYLKYYILYQCYKISHDSIQHFLIKFFSDRFIAQFYLVAKEQSFKCQIITVGFVRDLLLQIQVNCETESAKSTTETFIELCFIVSSLKDYFD